MKNSELKPCPFCGGEARIIESDPIYWVTCDGLTCNICAKTLPYSSREKAIEAWNTRVEHTCKNLATRKDDFYCSECGCEVVGCMVDDFGSFDNPLCFSCCPNCRARVVE